MPRKARRDSVDGLCHVRLRGNARKKLFRRVRDGERILGLLEHHLPANDVDCYGYCLMPNHVHLLVDAQQVDLSRAMRRVTATYAQWFNRVYSRTGHVFEGRFRADQVESDRHLTRSCIDTSS